jgi:hypothetical protein
VWAENEYRLVSGPDRVAIRGRSSDRGRRYGRCADIRTSALALVKALVFDTTLAAALTFVLGPKQTRA